MTTQVIEIMGRRVPYTVEEIDIYSLKYFIENPRINYLMSKCPANAVTDNVIEKALFDLDSTKDLIRDIEDNRGLLEAVIVLDSVVIEGNTRLLAYRRLYERVPHDQHWRNIRAHVIQEKLSSDEVFSLLSNYHIKGKTQWDLFEKAAYMDKMVREGKTIDQVRKIAGSKGPRVETMLKSYHAMKDVYLKKVDGTEDVQESLHKFSYFDALFSNKGLAGNLEHSEFLDEFCDWVIEGRLPKAQDVRELDKILGNKKAKEIFLDDSLVPRDAFREAAYKAYESHPEKAKGFYGDVQKFRELIAAQDHMRVKEECRRNKQMRFTVSRCLKDFQRFCKDIGIDQ
ncbi:MAG: hypothetical protein ACYC9Q_12050 [Bacillota bacterium]